MVRGKLISPGTHNRAMRGICSLLDAATERPRIVWITIRPKLARVRNLTVKLQCVECVAIAIRVLAVMKAHSDFLAEPQAGTPGVRTMTSHTCSVDKRQVLKHERLSASGLDLSTRRSRSGLTITSLHPAKRSCDLQHASSLRGC